MAGYRDSKALRPLPEDVVAQKTEEERGDIWTSLPGRIKSFDPATQTATVEVMYKPRHNGEAKPMPELVEVPVVFPRGGGGAVTFPVKAGDGVQVQFQARDMSNWYGKGDAHEAPSARMHDLSDAVAIPGLEPSTRKLANFNNEHIQLRSEDGTNAFSFDPASGKFKMTGSGGEEDLFIILKEFMQVMQFHTNAGMPHDQAGEVGALIARLNKMRLE